MEIHELYRPNAIIATWFNAERTAGYTLQADGTLNVVTRDCTADMWSPPTPIAAFSTAPSFEDFLRSVRQEDAE